ncbi:MAG: hypothetical protein Q9219_003385 [cf. Caloplaca sp. 3 TL-2023]
MPHSISPLKSTKAERARQYLRGGGILREDSDDELGLEDHPWEWIYSQETVDDGAEPDRIIGARMAEFQCAIGDCCLLKAEGSNEAWVGIICAFEEDDEDGDKAANFMWFSTEREIRNKQKKRTDSLPNEIYITPSWDVNPLESINGKATIVSAETFRQKYPSGKVPRLSKDYATYTEEFVWEDIYHGAGDLLDLIDHVKNQTKATRKRKRGVDDPAVDVRSHVLREPDRR